MTIKSLTALNMKEGLEALDRLLRIDLLLIVGGGSAMVLAHGFPPSTSDIDAAPKGLIIAELDILVK